MSYVFGPIIENLYGVGYNESNLVAMPYDWRIPPFILQQFVILFIIIIFK